METVENCPIWNVRSLAFGAAAQKRWLCKPLRGQKKSLKIVGRTDMAVEHQNSQTDRWTRPKNSRFGSFFEDAGCSMMKQLAITWRFLNIER